MKVLQINVSANSGSHGRIAEEIGRLVIKNGGESFIAYGRSVVKSKSSLIKIGSSIDLALHLAKTRLFDRHGFGSIYATKDLIREIDIINPDIIHLQNLHGYYLNIKILFEYLKRLNKPVVWTFHDTWPFTGHCTFFEHVNCNKWQTECYNCPLTHAYTKSWFIDNSRKNYRNKKELFVGLKNMVLVSPSEWLASHIRKSFLSSYEIKVVNNGVDLDKFKPVDSEAIRARHNINEKYILGVASVWTENKGLKDFIMLRKILDPEIEIVLVGLTASQAKSLPSSIKSIYRTENIDDLAALYSGAKAFVNPTYVDNFPSVNIEALACGTPVITYNTGGSMEAIDINTGRCVEKGNISKLHSSIMDVLNAHNQFQVEHCRERAVNRYSAHDRFGDYLELYNKIRTLL